MLSKSKKNTTKIFNNVFKRGKRYFSKHLILSVSSGVSGNATTCSFTVSRRVASGVVSRNRLRRVGYSVLEKHINNIKPSFVCVFSLQNTSDTTFQTLEREVLKLLQEAGLERADGVR